MLIYQRVMVGFEPGDIPSVGNVQKGELRFCDGKPEFLRCFPVITQMVRGFRWISFHTNLGWVETPPNGK